MKILQVKLGGVHSAFTDWKKHCLWSSASYEPMLVMLDNRKFHILDKFAAFMRELNVSYEDSSTIALAITNFYSDKSLLDKYNDKWDDRLLWEHVVELKEFVKEI